MSAGTAFSSATSAISFRTSLGHLLNKLLLLRQFSILPRITLVFICFGASAKIPIGPIEYKVLLKLERKYWEKVV